MPATFAELRARGEGSLTPPFRIENLTLYQLFLIAVRVAEIIEDFYGPRYGLSRAGWRVLLFAFSDPGVSARQIGRAVDLDQYAVSRAVGQLVELGFAERNLDPRDKRAISVEPTARGREVAVELIGLATRVEDELLDGLTPSDAEQFKSLIRRVEARSAKMLNSRWTAFLPDGVDASAAFIDFTKPGRESST